jgi:TatD DNase family protein
MIGVRKMFIDTHCHLNMMIEKKEREALGANDLKQIEQICNLANANNVGKIINIGSSLQDSIDSINIAKQMACVWAVVGIHPYDCNSDWQDKLSEIKKLIKNRSGKKIVGIGECGLDFYRKPYNEQIQNAAFKNQIELALEQNLPLVIHVRDAADEALKILEEFIKNKPRGVLHCFSQSPDFAKQVLDWGFYIGIDGHITYPKNDALRETIKNVPLNRLLLETDAPFLPPQQFRGKQNNPVYIPLIAQFIAGLRGIKLEELEQATTQNAQDLFGI